MPLLALLKFSSPRLTWRQYNNFVIFYNLEFRAENSGSHHT